MTTTAESLVVTPGDLLIGFAAVIALLAVAVASTAMIVGASRPAGTARRHRRPDPGRGPAITAGRVFVAGRASVSSAPASARPQLVADPGSSYCAHPATALVRSRGHAGLSPTRVLPSLHLTEEFTDVR